jgi:hypothetical protein
MEIKQKLYPSIPIASQNGNTPQICAPSRSSNKGPIIGELYARKPLIFAAVCLSIILHIHQSNYIFDRNIKNCYELLISL